MRCEARPATIEEVTPILHMLWGCIMETIKDEGDCHREVSRCSEAYVRLLMRRSPWHLISILVDGKLSGFLLSSTEQDENILEWAYVYPHARRTAAFMTAIRAYLGAMRQAEMRYLVAYTDPGNEVILAWARRFGLQIIPVNFGVGKVGASSQRSVMLVMKVGVDMPGDLI